MEWKSLSAEIKQLDEQGRGEARIATLQVRDADGDVLMPGLLGGTEQVVPLVPAHQWTVAPLGKTRVREQGRELIAAFQLNMKLSGARDWRTALQFDLDTPPPRQQWSFAFRIPEGGAERGMFEGQPVRFLKRLTLLEVSPVLVGASVNTATLSLKAEQDQAKFAEMETRVRAMTLKEGIPDTAAIVARAQETLARAEQLQIKLLVADFERICARAERPHGYKFLDVPRDDPKRGWAVKALGVAAEPLGLSSLKGIVSDVRFFEESPGEPDFRVKQKLMGGNFPDGLIGLHRDLSASELAATAAHELLHLVRPGATEKECDDFGRRIAAKMDAPRRSGGFTAEQLGHIARVIRSGLPIPR